MILLVYCSVHRLFLVSIVGSYMAALVSVLLSKTFQNSYKKQTLANISKKAF